MDKHYLVKLYDNIKKYYWFEQLSEKNGYNNCIINKFKSNKKQFEFDSRELTELYLSLSVYIYPRLCEFREITKTGDIGFPNIYSESEWINILDKIIFSFEEIITGRFDKEIFGNLSKVEYYDKIQEGLNLFGINFLYLWI